MANEGKNYDEGKVPLHLIPPEAEEGAARVLGYGAEKYQDPYNWRAGMAWSRTLSSAMRHLNAFRRGEDLDPESGLPHIDCALVRLMFLSTYQKTGTGMDDRYRPVPMASVADKVARWKQVEVHPDPGIVSAEGFMGGKGI